MVISLSQIAQREIRAEMARQQITQRELARRMKCSEMSISKRLRGVVPLSLDDLEHIGEALQVRPQHLIWPERHAI